MILYIFWGVSVLGAVGYSIKHPSKLNNQRFILALLFIFLFVLLGWSRGAYDVEIGISRYVNYEIMASFTEIGYTLLVKIFHILGFGYRGFFIVCSFIEILSIFWFTSKNCKKSQIAICLFLIYPFVVYLQYIRTLAAVPFVLIAIDSLINKPKHYIPKYVLCCLIAATLHFSSIFFLLYLPVLLMRKKSVVISTLIGAIVVQMAGSVGFLYNLVNYFLGTEKVGILERSVDAEGTFGRVFAICVTIAFLYVMIYIMKYVFKVSFNTYRDELYWKINFISIFCIPLTLHFGVGFARIPTLILVFNYPYLVEKVSEISSQKKRLFMYVLMVCYLVALFYLSFHNLEYRELVLYPFFEQNELINGILK